jgi:2TM family of unknown function (DUF5676)
MNAFLSQRIALATAGTLSVLWTVCSIFYALLPAFTMNVMGALFHMPMPLTTISWGSFLLGLVAIAIAGSLAGYVFALFLGLTERRAS